MKFTVQEIPNGLAGTIATIDLMKQFVAESQQRPTTRLTALNILRTAGVDSKNEAAAAHALYSWIKKNISYIKDPIDVETVQAPEITLQNHGGDCDDHAVLMAALAENIGIESKFSVIGNDENNFSHVFPEIYINRKWTPADTTSAIPFGDSHSLAIKKSFTNKGVVKMPTFQNVMRDNQNRSRIKSAAYHETRNVTRGLMQSGRMNFDDLENAILQAKATPIVRGSITEVLPDVVQALEIIKQEYNQQQPMIMPRRRNVQMTNRLSGMNGIFGDIWGKVKGAVTNIVKNVTTPTQPARRENVPQPVAPQAAATFGDTITKPMFLLAGIAAIFYIFKARE